MKRMIILLALCLLLCGCAEIMGNSYHSITPHRANEQEQQAHSRSVANATQLKRELYDILENGLEDAVLFVEDYPAGQLIPELEKALQNATTNHPIGAYAVETITYEQGTRSGRTAVALAITYTRSAEELAAIKRAQNMDQVREQLRQALTACDSGLVTRVTAYSNEDLSQYVEDFMDENPSVVMELPQVTVTVYPDSGTDRVLDIRFAYQNSRDSLRQMQRYVQPVFSSAKLYVGNEEESAAVKYARLYTFLMERNDYKAETSITPAYSLLRHGVGDSKAFAVVYAQMCREAGLECLVVTGTHNGEARFWNIIHDDGIYYHVDLLSPNGFIKYSDAQLAGYVWDYSAYPACGVQSGG